MSSSQSNRNPAASPKAASAQRLRSTGPAPAAVAPTSAQPTICQAVHGPCPRKMFEPSAAVNRRVGSSAQGGGHATIMVTGRTRWE
jgi:hypothetical protein